MSLLSSQPSEVALADDMPFFKPSIAQLGLRTPPPSPEDARNCFGQHYARFPLPRFLRRTQPTRSPNFLAQNCSNTEAPHVSRNDNAPLHPTCSPFRAVQHMKEPFPLVLPASPASSSRSVDEKCTPQRLRKVSLSYPDLRALPPEQLLTAKTSKPLALLPSPVFSELQINQIPGSNGTNLTSNDQHASVVPLDAAHSLHEEDDIISNYYDSGEMRTYHQNTGDRDTTSPAQILVAEKQRHEGRRDVGIVGAPSSFPRCQRRSQRGRSTSCSSEANWLGGTMSEKIMLEEWLCDLHESAASPGHGRDDDNTDHQIMHATRLKGAGRPKVVTISRPMSLSTTSTSILYNLRSPERVCTPTQRYQEISVFSPETPLRDSQRTSRWSMTSLRPAPLTPQRYRRYDHSTPQRSSSGRSQSFRAALELSPTESQDTLATDFSSYTTRNSMRTPPEVGSPSSEAAAWSRCSNLEKILEAVTQAVDTFPDNMLRLDSPAILAMRRPKPSNEIHIAALQRIFPQTASLLLSALAASLMVDSYLSNLKEQCTPPPNILPQSPAKQRYSRLAARSNECLHDIPIKARATLGIHLPNVTELQDHERALKRRAEMVAVCMEIQGQRLLEAICGRFDDIIWKALKVLVETLEGNQS